MDKKSWLAFGIALVANVLLIFGLQLECPWNSMFGYDCGGCGTTRMMFSLLHLDFYQAFRYNPFMITVKNNRLEALDKIYLEVLNLTNEELKNLIIKNPDTYIVSVSELNKNIDYLREHNCNIETIRNFLITNPQLISMSPEEFKNIVKFN